jgi:hypothetical protein
MTGNYRWGRPKHSNIGAVYRYYLCRVFQTAIVRKIYFTGIQLAQCTVTVN